MADAVALAIDSRAAWGAATRQDGSTQLRTGQFAGTGRIESRSSWGAATRQDGATHLRTGQFSGTAQAVSRSVWTASTRQDGSIRSQWAGPRTNRVFILGPSTGFTTYAGGGYGRMGYGMAPPSIQRIEQPTAASSTSESCWSVPIRADQGMRLPFGARKPVSGGWTVVVEPGGPPVDANGTIIVPIRGVYFVSNVVDVVRVSDGLPLETLSASVNIDDTSWTWSLTATLSYRMWADVQPPVDGSPLIISVNINGYAFQFRIEGISRARRFGETVVNVSGRGIAAELAAPAAPIQIWTNTADRTAQQIMGDVLLNTGWTVGWQVTDWLVPANTFSKQGTPIDAINAIAGAIKASVQSDPSAKILHILPRYKVAPWNWATATPDVSLPLDPVITDSIEEVIRPNYNRVFVTGTNGAGRIGQVTINGTAGDIIAPTATDPLITAIEASQQLGLAILGDTGKQWQVGITGPVSVDLPLLVNGQLIAYDQTGENRRGQVRSIGMRADWGNNGLDVSQSAKLEVHG
ncbi:MAG: hypothetical protein ACYC3A_05660 [Halothiobacillus sp.]